MKAPAAISAIVLLAAGAAHATTVTLDLNALPVGPFTMLLTVDGYELTPSLGPSAVPSILDFNGNNVVSNDDVRGSYAGNDVILSRVDGGVFTLDSVTIGFEGESRGAQAVNSNVAGGNNLDTSVTPQTIRFGAQFAGSTWVDLNEQGGPYFTNITVSTGVPEPGAWSLMLIGFGALGCAMRRQRRLPRAAALT